MGFLDKFKKQGAELKDKASDLANKATKGKYDEKIDGAADKAKEAADKLAEGDKPTA